MPINFPNSPTLGDIFSVGNQRFQWDGVAWTALVEDSMSVSATPPANPVEGTMWFDEDNARLYVWYDDGDSAQWVNVVSYPGFTPFRDDGAYVYYDGALNVGIGTATPSVSLDINRTDAVQLPAGTDAQRPGTPAEGMIRYNTTTPQFEGYSSTSWIALGIPSGIITMWSGSIATIPAGWALCDGTSGTPDLRDRFVVGAGTTYTPGNTGGANTVALSTAELPSHTHSDGTLAAASAGAHTHGITDPGHSHSGSLFRAGASFILQSVAGALHAQGNTNSATTGITVNSGGAHTHDVTGSTGATGSGSAHENRPPYYALAYIMKL